MSKKFREKLEKSLIEETEILEKSFIKNALFTGALAASTMAGAKTNQEPATPKHESKMEQSVKQGPKYSKDQILDAIAQIETSGGKDLKHDTITDPNNLNYGTHSRSKFGMMPVTIKDVIKKDKGLKKQYGHLLDLDHKKQAFHDAYHADPSLDRKIASKYYDKAAKLFGHDHEKILHSWLNGRTATLRAVKKGKDLGKHWHVKKGTKALESIVNSSKKLPQSKHNL